MQMPDVKLCCYYESLPDHKMIQSALRVMITMKFMIKYYAYTEKIVFSK